MARKGWLELYKSCHGICFMTFLMEKIYSKEYIPKIPKNGMDFLMELEKRKTVLMILQTCLNSGQSHHSNYDFEKGE